MPAVRSQVNKYVELFMTVLSDVEALTGLSLARDKRMIQERVASEGLPFLTKALPNFSKHMLTCIESGTWTPIAGFSHRRSGPLPLFLGGLVRRIFDEEGQILDECDACAQLYVDQICGLMYKTRFGYPERVVRKKCEEYVNLDANVKVDYSDLSPKHIKILDNARLFIREYLEGFGLTELPRHGPGAVAGREHGFDKYNFEVPERVAKVFPWQCFFSVREIDATGYHYPVPVTPTQGLPPARVVFVEKDSRGPRTISCEPKELQWLQQSIGRSIMSYAEQHPWSKGHLNFTDQSINGKLAKNASLDRQLATLDLSEASDRLSNNLVWLLFPEPLRTWLMVTRSEYSKLPNKVVVRLRKFSPMGSACTFPVESLVFYAICVGTNAYLIETSKDWVEARRSVYVYGDDIIVDSMHAGEIIESLEAFGLKVNKSKSFIRGPFRESCGINAMNGVVTTPIRLRNQIPTRRSDIKSIISLLETSNLLFYAGFWKASDLLVRWLEGLTGPLPYVPKGSGSLGVCGYKPVYAGRSKTLKIKWSKRYMAPQVIVKTVQSVIAEEEEPEEGTPPNSLLSVLAKSETPPRPYEGQRLTTVGVDVGTDRRLFIRPSRVILS